MFTFDDLNAPQLKDGKTGERQHEEIYAMLPNDVIHYNFDENPSKARDAQRFCHTLARARGWKMRTKTIARDGVKYMVIGRLE